MKVGGAGNPSIEPARRRAGGSVAGSAAARATSTTRIDSKSFLGIPATELTPAVQDAIQVLLGELDALRGEVGQLKARLAEAEGLADRDALTPLLNRRGFLRELGRVRAFAQRNGSPASLVYFDLDGFKAINDRFGHAAGDAALLAVAQRLTANVRESDVLGRMGGDEFAIVLIQADQATAEAKAEALAEAIEREPLPVGDGTVRIRVSYGVREIAMDAEPEALIAAADAAMFTVKRQRRTA